MAGEIFISYRRSRSEAAERVEAVLREAGYANYQIFRDVDGLVSGESFESQLNSTLGRTEIVLFLLGPGDVPRDAADDWVTMELRAALRLQKPVVTVVLDGAEAEVRAPWPTDLESLKSPEFARFSTVSSTGRDQILQILRRRGIPPVRESLKKWDSLLAHNRIDGAVTELTNVIRDRTSGIVVVHGRPGTGRSHVLKSVIGDLRRTGVRVGLHEPIRLPADADGAVVYDWIAGLLTEGCEAELGTPSSNDLPAEVIAMDSNGMSTKMLSAKVRARLGHEGRLNMIASQRAAAAHDQYGKVAGAILLFEQLAQPAPLVLVVDDVDFADATSQEVIRELASAISEDSARIILVVGAETGAWPITCLPRDVEPERVAVIPDVASMLMRGRIDQRLIDRFIELDLSPVECVTYLKYLQGNDLLTSSAAGWAFTGDPSNELPNIAAALDAELKAILPAASQQTLELGAIIGYRFRFAVADAVASRGAADAQAALAELYRYDVDQRVVRGATEAGCDRITLSSSVWWRHLRARRTLADGSFDPKDLRLLATALEKVADASDGGLEDWTSVGELYDRLADPEKAGSAYVRAAHIARRRLSPEAAARYYRDAAERFEAHVVGNLVQPLERARTLLRAGYCWHRAAALETSASVRHRGSALTHAEDVLDQAREELHAHRPEHERDVNLDDMITRGIDVQSEEGELIWLQWHTIRAYVKVEKGRRSLESGEAASQEFTSALTEAETGLSGWACYLLIVVASAGLAHSLLSDPEFTQESAHRSRGRARAAYFHSARSMMLLRRHEARFRKVIRTEPQIAAQLDLARQWVNEARRTIGEKLGLKSLVAFAGGDQPSTDAEIICLLTDLDTVMSGRSTEPHATGFVEHADDLLRRAADLATTASDSTISTDIRIAAFAHDLFRSVDGARLLRLWRDLNEPAIDDLTWHNPILLHGPIAARFCALDLGLEELIGAPRFARIRHALESHTVGSSKVGDSSDEARFAQIAHLADMRARPHVGNEIDSVWENSFKPEGLLRAYGLCFSHQAQRLRAEGNLVSTITEDVIKSCEMSSPTSPT